MKFYKIICLTKNSYKENYLKRINKYHLDTLLAFKLTEAIPYNPDYKKDLNLLIKIKQEKDKKNV